MKSIAILGAALAITAFSVANANSMPQGHDVGGPTQQGQYCWVYTSANGAGFWDHCDETGRAISLHGRENAIDIAGGDGGGGGGNR